MLAPRRSLALAATLSALTATACAPTLGPPPPGAGPPPPPMSGNAQFNAGDFAWSQRSGANVIAGKVAYRQGPTRYTCAGSANLRYLVKVKANYTPASGETLTIRGAYVATN